MRLVSERAQLNSTQPTVFPGLNETLGVLVATEAGGRFPDRFGDTRIDTGGGLYTNGALDQQIQRTAGLRLSDWSD